MIIEKFVTIHGSDEHAHPIELKISGMLGLYKVIERARNEGVLGEFRITYHITRDGVPTKDYPQHWLVSVDNYSERLRGK